MGKFNQGILGGFTGKVGNVVGSRSRGEWIYRAYQGIVKNPKTLAQTKQREQFRIFSQEIAHVCKADKPIFDSAFPKGMTYQSFLVNVCFNMLRAYQVYPKKPFESLKNVGLSNAIGNIGGLINYAPTATANAKPEAPVFGNTTGKKEGEQFYGLNFNNDLNYYNNVIKNQGSLGEQIKLFAMWLSIGDDGFYHISLARGGGLAATNGIETTNSISTEISGVAKCGWYDTAPDTDAWAWVKASVNVPDNWQIFHYGFNHYMADQDEGGKLLNQIPIYYHWFTNSSKIPLGSICKLIDVVRPQ